MQMLHGHHGWNCSNLLLHDCGFGPNGSHQVQEYNSMHAELLTIE